MVFECSFQLKYGSVVICILRVCSMLFWRLHGYINCVPIYITILNVILYESLLVAYTIIVFYLFDILSIRMYVDVV